jgi:hypothetical protein
MSDTLPYPENRGQTHHEGCWRVRGHHNCCVDRVGALEAKRDLSDDDREALRAMASTAVWISDEIDEDPEVIAKIDRAVGLLEALGVEHITGRDPDRPALLAEVARLRDALVELLALYPDDMTDDGSGRVGFTLAVQSAVYNARRALNPNEHPTKEEAS